MEMTKQFLKAQCKKDSLYSTPHINDKLYLHYKVRATTVVCEHLVRRQSNAPCRVSEQ